MSVSSNEANYRNLIFSVSSNWSDTQNDWHLASLVHEMGHIIEFNYKGVSGSPNWAEEAWGDSRWAGIFQWDMYQKVAELLPAGFKDRQWKELVEGVDSDGDLLVPRFLLPAL